MLARNLFRESAKTGNRTFFRGCVMSTRAGVERHARWENSIRNAVIAVTVTVLMATMVLAPGRAMANPKFAAVAIDAHSGEVVFSRYADSRRYPASLSKVMTLYVLFQEMRAGRLSKDSRITMSRHAASMQPSKLGLKPGQTITVDHAIKSLVTKSANDVAAAVAEAVSGSEKAFAVRMTKTARALGMTRTTFRNASGLPNGGQVTTARDMATLGLRIQKDFPEYYGYFALTSFSYNGKTYRNHNKLVGRYKGTDGIKTGYIRASGFNLLASVKRDGKHVVAVVMGGRTGASRNAYMISTLDKVFPKVKSRTTLKIANVAGDPPGYDRQTVTAASRAVQRALKPPLPNPKPTLVAAETGGAMVEADIMSVMPDADGPARSGAPLKVVALTPEEGDTGDAPTIVSGEDGMARGDTWHIQVGAFDSEAGAETYLRKVLKTGVSTLDDRPAFIMPFERGNAMFYRARLAGFDESSANKACKALARHSYACFAVAPPAQ